LSQLLFRVANYWGLALVLVWKEFFRFVVDFIVFSVTLQPYYDQRNAQNKAFIQYGISKKWDIILTSNDEGRANTTTNEKTLSRYLGKEYRATPPPPPWKETTELAGILY